MILTCPNCATRYLTEDRQIGPAGRRVRCEACGHQWSAPGAPAPLEPPVEDSAAAAPMFAPRPFPAARISPRVRPPARRGRAIWAAAVFVLVVGGALAFRAEITRAWPASAVAYATVGMEPS
ncbi:MAG: MJ0042-type zinc finger domain-containing protein [Caulobacteraceae bacterium]